MKKIILVFSLILTGSIVRSQASASSLIDADIKIKLEKIKDNIDYLFQTFKSDKQPDPNVNFDNSYITDLSFYNIKGTLSSNNFNENMSFRISTADYKKATRADFEEAYTELADDLKDTFDFLELRQKEAADSKELTLYELGKDTNVPVADPRSPKYYIKVKFEQEKNDKTTSYSIFLYFSVKK